MKIKTSALFSIAGLLWMIAGLFAALNHKPVTIQVACGVLFIAVAAMIRRRERAAANSGAKT